MSDTPGFTWLQLFTGGISATAITTFLGWYSGRRQQTAYAVKTEAEAHKLEAEVQDLADSKNSDFERVLNERAGKVFEVLSKHIEELRSEIVALRKENDSMRTEIIELRKALDKTRHEMQKDMVLPIDPTLEFSV